jgi:hypothetical protein
MKTHWMMMMFLLAAVALTACGDGGGEGDVATDEDAGDADGRDVPADRDVPRDDVAPEEVTEVVGEDVPAEDITPDNPDAPPPPPCEAPPDPVLGMECTASTDCGGDYPSCYTERRQEYNGEEYVSWLGGYCAEMGARDFICDIEDPVATCGEGMKCMYLYDMGDIPIYGCMDACNPEKPGTDPPELYDFNCGCRSEYYCEMNAGTCLPGCSNDRECCEIWRDADGDLARDEGEVELLTACTNWCDDDPTIDGGASYNCINEGTAGAEFSGPCVHDSLCPADGRCLDPYNSTDDAGNPNFPGGYCLKDRCDAVGRGCTDGAGHCGNLNTTADPFWACVKACHVGDDPDGAGFPCRKTPAEEKMTCVPNFTDQPYLDTTDFDGYCWYGNFNTVTDPDYATDCTAPEECWSPLGLGNCYTLVDAGISFCSVMCTQDLAVDHAVCGSDAQGVCWASETGMCWPACDAPGGAPGANGCPATSPPAWACYATADYADDTFVASAATMPAGFCFPVCVDDAWCGDMFGTAMTCDTTSGVCHL